MRMTNLDKEWLKKCISEPNKYKIYVDNDDIFIVDIIKEENDEEDCVLYSFSNFGYDFAYDLLDYLKCNVDYV